jgi:hypothetical protein
MHRKKVVPKWFSEIFRELVRCEEMTSNELIAEIDSTRFMQDEVVFELLRRGLRATLLKHYKNDDAICQHIIEMDDLQESLRKYLDAKEKSEARLE